MIALRGDDLASITIRKLDERTKARLRLRAARHGRSMEEEAPGRGRAPDARPRADPRAAQAAADLYTTSITQAEILHGVMLLPSGRRRSALEAAATATRNAADFDGCGVSVVDPWETR